MSAKRRIDWRNFSSAAFLHVDATWIKFTWDEQHMQIHNQYSDSTWFLQIKTECWRLTLWLYQCVLDQTIITVHEVLTIVCSP
jgi:hypothetical protein